MPERFEIALLHVSEVFSRQLRPGIVYHTFEHTQAVLNVIDELCEAEGVTEADWDLLRIAALFHDAGYSIEGDGHEEHGAQMAGTFMSKIKYSREEKDAVMRYIRSTSLLAPPADLLEKIMRDADLHYLGTVDFFRQADLLRREWEFTQHKILSDAEWYQTNLDFFGRHRFYTATARHKYDALKETNRVEIAGRLQSLGK